MIHRHHRRKDRKDNRAVNILLVPDVVHEWIERHPEEARELGWSVSRYDDPAEVSIQIPEKLVFVEKEKKPRAKTKARNRATVQMRVPQDHNEDGAGLWDDHMALGRELLCERMGWNDDVPDYNVAMVLVAQGLEANRDLLGGKETT